MPNMNAQLLQSFLNSIDNLIKILKAENMIVKY